MENKEEAEQECHLYENILGIASTTRTFYPFDFCLEQPLMILRKFLRDLAEFPSVLPKPEEHLYILELGREVLVNLVNEKVAAERKVELLFWLYLNCAVACFSLQDHYGFTTKYWSLFSSRYEAVLKSWTLGWEGVDADKAAKIVAKIEAYYKKNSPKRKKGAAINKVP